MAAGLDRMCWVLKAFCSTAKMSLCRCVAYLLQWKSRCGTSSVMFGQCVQYGVSDLFIWWRWPLSGVCPVRICVRMLICLRLSSLVASMNLEEGKEGSIALILLYHLLFFHQMIVSLFMNLLICCLMAARLEGSFLRRKSGSKSSLLKPNSAASLASSSATSFPFDPMWSATHVRLISNVGLS